MTTMQRLPRLARSVAVSAMLCCISLYSNAQDSKGKGAEVTKAIAVIHPTQGNQASGLVRFTKVEDGIRIVAEIKGLSPGKHGFHIHEFGDCSAPDASSAGGHFNPTGMPHGGAQTGKIHTGPISHVGDMGNVTADASGVAKFELLSTEMSFTGANSILGRAVIVHAKEDDLKSQPSGDTSGRLGCGVIGIAKPSA